MLSTWPITRRAHGPEKKTSENTGATVTCENQFVLQFNSVLEDLMMFKLGRYFFVVVNFHWLSALFRASTLGQKGNYVMMSNAKNRVHRVIQQISKRLTYHSRYA